jgi:hypothetical protein
MRMWCSEKEERRSKKGANERLVFREGGRYETTRRQREEHNANDEFEGR